MSQEGARAGMRVGNCSNTGDVIILVPYSDCESYLFTFTPEGALAFAADITDKASAGRRMKSLAAQIETLSEEKKL